jgi:hypothetical protein
MDALFAEERHPDKGRELARLAAAANSAHRLAGESAGSAIAHAVAAGNALARAREICEHGEWLAWLRRNFHGTTRTAQRYIQLVRNWRALNSNATRASPLSLRAAHRSLRDALLGEIPGAPRVRELSASARTDGLLTDRLATTERAVAGLGALAANLTARLADTDAFGRYAIRRILELRDELRLDSGRPAAGPSDGLVYFIEAVGAGRIKIGHARDPQARLRELQTGSAYTLRLMAMVPGGMALERALHRRFADLRLAGEWFHATPPLLAEIAAITKASHHD